ncbi:hypothetical protein DL96DRAFT_1587263 [Flagelloscypha sp. PMI_526]|nr:hypothetical protein DL96DRAFT_1587263 [Flagelloscypha sp. PMI_526]
MPPKKLREQRTRQVNVINPTLNPDLIAQRKRRRIADLERSNYTDGGPGDGDDDDEPGSSRRGNARQTISDKRSLKLPGTSPAAGKKKSTMAVRTALLYRKNLDTLISESGINKSVGPSYLHAAALPSIYPPRLLCSVCGFGAQYKCPKCLTPYCEPTCRETHSATPGLCSF